MKFINNSIKESKVHSLAWNIKKKKCFFENELDEFLNVKT